MRIPVRITKGDFKDHEGYLTTHEVRGYVVYIPDMAEDFDFQHHELQLLPVRPYAELKAKIKNLNS